MPVQNSIGRDPLGQNLTGSMSLLPSWSKTRNLGTHHNESRQRLPKHFGDRARQ